MVTSGRYFDLVREIQPSSALVESVRERGIKPTARLFATSTLTVRKLWRRYQQHGPSGLQEHSRAPHRHPLHTSNSTSWHCEKNCPPSEPRGCGANLICPFRTWPCSGSGANMAC